MNNFDLEKLLRENYCDTFDSLKPVDKQSVYAVYEKKPKGKVRKRSFYLKVAIAIILLALLAVGTVTVTASNATFREKLAERAKKDNVNLTDSELDELSSRLTQRGLLDENEILPKMGENENGQLYGSDLYGFELMAVSGRNDDIGYCYIDEFEYMIGDPDYIFEVYNDAVDWQNDRDNGLNRNWVYVFDSDGMKIIGKYIKSIKKDKEELEEKRIGLGFITNEELAAGEYDKYIYDGFDSVFYEAEVMERLENLHVSVENKAPFPNDEELPEMGENDKGQKYGDFRYNFDLQPCAYYKDGYIYTDDYKDVYGIRVPWLYDVSEWDEVHKHTRNWNYVYESDGETIVGVTFNSSDYIEYEGNDEKPYSSGFCTLEEFESGEYDKYIYNGIDNGEKYKEKVRKRQLYFDKLRELGKIE